MKFTRKIALALPTLSLKGMKAGDIKIIEAVGELTKETITEKDASGMDVEQEIALLHAIDSATGEEGQIIVPHVITKALEGAGEIQGRFFELTKGKMVRRCCHWSVWEVAPDGK